jgi:hypothetical protein
MRLWSSPRFKILDLGLVLEFRATAGELTSLVAVTARHAAVMRLISRSETLKVLRGTLGSTFSHLYTIRPGGEMHGEDKLLLGIADGIDDGHVELNFLMLSPIVMWTRYFANWPKLET